MASSIFPLPPIAAVEVTSAAAIAAAAITASNVAEAQSTASVVELSAQAQILSANLAANTLENEAQSALVFEKNAEQLATLEVAAQAKLTQDAIAAQKSGLITTETNVINQVVQSELADAALSEAVAATASAAAAETTTISATAPNTAATTIVSSTTNTTPASTAPVPTTTNPVPINFEAIESEANVLLNAMMAAEPNPALPITDTAVAAAIAAYRVADQLVSATETRPDDTTPEVDTDIAAPEKIQATTLDLHDSPRDDALNGPIWNWSRVHPVQGKLKRR